MAMIGKKKKNKKQAFTIFWILFMPGMDCQQKFYINQADVNLFW